MFEIWCPAFAGAVLVEMLFSKRQETVWMWRALAHRGVRVQGPGCDGPLRCRTARSARGLHLAHCVRPQELHMNSALVQHGLRACNSTKVRRRSHKTWAPCPPFTWRWGRYRRLPRKRLGRIRPPLLPLEMVVRRGCTFERLCFSPRYGRCSGGLRKLPRRCSRWAFELARAKVS